MIANFMKEAFIVQRYIPAKGVGPSVIRCNLTVERYPYIDRNASEIELQKGLKQGDSPMISLKVYKISSKNHFTGLKTVIKNLDDETPPCRIDN